MPNYFRYPVLVKVITGFSLFFILFNYPNTAQASDPNSVIVQWAANLDPDIAGYRVYQGTRPGSYGYSIDVGNVTSFTASNLQVDSTYYFAITAYDSAGNESSPSEEVHIQLVDTLPITLTTLPINVLSNEANIANLTPNN